MMHSYKSSRKTNTNKEIDVVAGATFILKGDERITSNNAKNVHIIEKK
jgi:hypothetical protein